MSKSKKSRKSTLAKQLAQYSLAVGAAMVGADQAQASIVSSPPGSVAFGAALGTQPISFGQASPRVALFGYSTAYGYGGFGKLQLFGASGAAPDFNLLLTGSGSNGEVAKLGPGAVIGPSQNTPQGNNGLFYGRLLGATYYGSYYSIASVGQWTYDGADGFMGFSFLLGGETKVFGWAEIERLDQADGVLLGWAYENSGASITIPGAPAVPEPLTLLGVVLGAAGIDAYRRRRQA